ncbi:MAG: hypothetical protein JRC86_11935, partial [Deltaproteobacteria bacterium]|nr:hypothetical protein [Deltaproteobacteria bacterium]
MADFFDNIPPSMVGRALGDIQRSYPDALGIQQALTNLPAQSTADLQEQLGIKPNQEGFFSNIGDFTQSTFSAAFPELVGFEPSKDVQQWREQHPGLGLTTQLLGFAGPAMIPFVGGGIFGIKAVASFGKGAKALDAIEVMKNTFMAGAAAESLRWAPFQLGRLGASVALSPFGASPWEVTKSLAIEAPLFGAMGGGIHFLSKTGGSAIPEMARRGTGIYAQELEVGYKIPGYNIDAPIQDKVEKLLAYGQSADGVALGEKLTNITDHYKVLVGKETLESLARYHGGKAYKDHAGPVQGKYGEGVSVRSTRM